jgi:hypothetical protein
VVWHYDSVDRNKNGKKDFEETMHRTIGSVAIKADLLFISNKSTLFALKSGAKLKGGVKQGSTEGGGGNE